MNNSQKTSTRLVQQLLARGQFIHNQNSK